MEARRLEELNAGVEIYAGAEWEGAAGGRGAVPPASNPPCWRRPQRTGGCDARGAAPLHSRKAAEEGDWALPKWGASIASAVGNECCGRGPRRAGASGADWEARPDGRMT